MKIKTTFFLILILLGGNSLGQSHTKSTIHDLIQIHTEEIYDSLVIIRRDLHMHPEISEQEQRTSAQIASYLLSLGLEVKTNIGGYGVIGILNTGRLGKKIAWRADIDAIKTNQPDVVEYKSKNEGIRHICGHDVHTTIGLGIANVLTKNKDKLNGVIYFVFQPAEENFKGAKAMLDNGLFDIISPEEIYGLHMSPMSSGYISARTGNVYASRYTMTLTFRNSKKNDEIIEYTTALVNSFDNGKSGYDIWDSRNLGDPEVGVSNPNSIYKNFVHVNKNHTLDKDTTDFTIFSVITSSDISLLDTTLVLIVNRIRKSKYAKEFVSAKYVYKHPAVINDPALTKASLNSIANIYGEEQIVYTYGAIPQFNDDFAYFQQHVPGVYFFLGGSNSEKGLISMPHTPNFAVDEECIKVGVKYFTSLIYERLAIE